MKNKKTSLLIFGILSLCFISFNTVSANIYAGKDYTLKSRDVKITVTDVDTFSISGLRENEGILDINIKHLKSASKKKDVRLTVVCSDNKYENVADICNQDYIFDTANLRIHYVSSVPKSKITLQFAIGEIERNTGNWATIDYLLEDKIELNYQKKNSKNSKVKITSPKDGKKVYFGSYVVLRWNLETNGFVNILNCMPDKTGCSPVNGGKNFVSGKKGNRVNIYADSIISGNSLIKVENALNPSKFDLVEVVALPRQ